VFKILRVSNHYSVAELYIVSRELVYFACNIEPGPITVLNANDLYSLRLRTLTHVSDKL
jgi:hypothetical protein